MKDYYAPEIIIIFSADVITVSDGDTPFVDYEQW
jgi:hypothetical protein